jgi:hypothetical protein
MIRIAAVLLVALGLAACDAMNTMTEGFNHAKAVETDLEGSTGVRPNVGFSWNNGRLTSVTVTYPRLNETKPLPELAATIREAVTKEFKQKPERIVVAFAVEG